MSGFPEFTKVRTDPTLVKLEELNAVSELGYKAGRALRDIALRTEADLGPTREFVTLVYDELRDALEGSRNSGRRTNYAPEELVLRVMPESDEKGDQVISAREKLRQLNQISETLDAVLQGHAPLNAQEALEIYELVNPFYETYVKLAGETAEELTAV